VVVYINSREYFKEFIIRPYGHKTLPRTTFCTRTPILSNQGTEYIEYSTLIGCFSSTNTKIVL